MRRPVCFLKLATTRCYAAGNQRAVALNTPHAAASEDAGLRLVLNPREHSPVVVVLPTMYAESNRGAFALTINSVIGCTRRTGLEPETH